MTPALNHIGLAVANLTAVMSWYSHNFGLQPYPQILSVRKAENPENPIFQLNSNVETVDVGFAKFSNGVGIEFFQFGGERFDNDQSLGRGESHPQMKSNEILDKELSGFFHFALTVADPIAAQAQIDSTGGDVLGITIPVGLGGIATYNRDPMGNIIETISCDFEDITKNVFEG